MGRFLGILVLLILAILDILPAVITLIISWDKTYISKRNKGRKWLDLVVFVSCGAIHLGTFLFIHKVLVGRWNFLYTAKRIVEFDYTYQDIDYWPISLAARLIVALVCGVLIRFALTKVKNGRYKCPPLSKRRIVALLLLLFVVGVSVIGTLSYSFNGHQSLVINEVGGYNTSIPLDEEGTVCDYVELYNTGSLDCAVYELYLTDDSNILRKKEIPPVIVPAKGYLVIELGDSTLNISKDGGETLILSNSWGRILDQVTTTVVEPNFSCCREQDGADVWVVCSSTPGKTNADGKRRLEHTPVLSHESGFYDAEFDLHIMAQEGEIIYYTLDGSTPTTESTVYTQPICVYDRSDEPNVWRSQERVQTDWKLYPPTQKTPVDKAFIVRAIAVSPDGAISKPVTATYFINLEAYAEGAVVSLVADPEEIWGENGIYVTGLAYDEWYLGDQNGTAPEANFLKRGREWEKPANFCYLSEGLHFSQDIGLRITGSSSRTLELKSFSLYSRQEYSGSSVFDRNIFPGVQSSRLAIRGGYANSICQILATDRNLGIQKWQRVAVFLNGEFWYNANILEKYDSQYFYEYYGVNPANVVVVKKGLIEEGQAGDEQLLKELYDYLDAYDLSDSEAYAGFCELVDIQSYIDYMCFNIYIDNLDFTETKNAVWWRSREKTFKPYEDGKWRFVLYDLDAMEWGDASLWGKETQEQKNSFSIIPRYTGGQAINQHPIYAALKMNTQYQKQFVLTFMDMVNTTFQYENVVEAINMYGRDTENYLGGNSGTRPISYYEEFFAERARYIVPYMAEEFELTGTLETITVCQNDSAGGTIKINTIQPEMVDGQWTGQYYTDYPVTVTAIPAEGYRFVGWEGAVNTDAVEVEVTLTEGGVRLNAIFEKIEP